MNKFCQFFIFQFHKLRVLVSLRGCFSFCFAKFCKLKIGTQLDTGDRPRAPTCTCNKLQVWQLNLSGVQVES